MKRSIGILLSLLMMITMLPMMPSTSTQALEYFVENGFQYTVENGEARITESKGEHGANLVIPSTLGGYPVTTIGDRAFMNCTSIVSVEIPESVTKIEHLVFYGCTALTDITLPKNLEFLGYRSFENTAYFNDESNWENGVLYIDHCLIYTDYETVLKNYTIKDGTTVIAASAFNYNSTLTGVVIPDTVTRIDMYTFTMCGVLTSVTLPSTLTHIGMYAFDGCAALKSVTIPDSIEVIEHGAFMRCDSLADITIPQHAFSISYGVFSGTAYYNDESNWENDALYMGVHLLNVKNTMCDYAVKHGTKTIASYAFAYCDMLDSVTIPSSVERICKEAFFACSDLMDVKIENGVKTLEQYAVNCCSQLTSITIPASVTEMYSDSISNCDNLTMIQVDENNPAYCDKDGGVLYTKDGKTLMKYPPKRFGTSYEIPDGVTAIESAAFDECSFLTKLTIPKSVTDIHQYAFSNCSELKDVYYAGTEEEWNALGTVTNATIHFPGETGDVTEDGVLNMMDVMAMYGGASGSQSLSVMQKAVCDINGDGTVTMMDVLALYKQVSGNQ